MRSCVHAHCRLVYLFWGFLLVKWPKMSKGLKALEAGDWETADRLAARYVPQWANRLLKLAGVTVTVEGKENIPRRPGLRVCGQPPQLLRHPP